MNQTSQQPARAPIDMIRMARSIAVQPPYFAFKSLYKQPGKWDIYGVVEPEQPKGNELGLLATAEAGRHLAILGSCAAALSQAEDERVYYLASRAQWALQPSLLPLGLPQSLTARAMIVERSRKMVAAHTQLLIGHELYGELWVRYQVLSEKTFEKVFSPYQSPTPPSSVRSPYANALQLTVIVLTKKDITARSFGFSKVQCEGHFPRYPAWPVAIIMSGLNQVVSLLLDHKLGRTALFKLTQVTVEATELVPADKQLEFSARLFSMSTDGRHCDVVCSAVSDGRVIAGASAELEIP